MHLDQAIKSVLDRLGAWGLLILLAPFLAAIALAIRLDSPGSPLFLQERVGLRGRSFTIFKFRTMRAGSEKSGLGSTTASHDDRITRVGRWLRATSLDELPQLFNIALGEMSFIGPRPTLRYQVEQYTPVQKRRLDLRPGITGWAQIHGRNDISWDKRIELDLEYIDHWSLGLDVRILCRTVEVLLKGQGVYAAGAANDAFAAAPGSDLNEPFAASNRTASIDIDLSEPLESRPGSPAASASRALPPAPMTSLAPVVATSHTPALAISQAPAPAKSQAAAPAKSQTPAPAKSQTPAPAKSQTPAPTTPLALAPAVSPVGASEKGLLPLLIIGAGGHARVIADIVEKQARYRVVGLIDDRQLLAGTRVLGYPVLGGREILDRADLPSHAIVAIGSPQARARWQEHLEERGFQIAVLVHPSAQVGREVSIAAGTVLMAGAIVNSGSRLGRGVIVNTAASIDHDCDIGDFAHVAPGARLAGGVHIGERTHVGLGACVLQDRMLGDDVIVGAGAVVVERVDAGLTVVGVPARPLANRARTVRAVAPA